MNRYLLPILSILLLASCNQETKKAKHIIFEINVEEGIKNKVHKLLLSDAVMDIDIIPLETNDSCFIQKIRKMYIGENDLFINNVSVAYSRLFRFDKSGKFKNIVSREGDGPMHIMSIDGFGIDEKNRLVHVANAFGFQNEIKTYKYDGTWTNTIHPARPGEALFGSFDWDQRGYNYFNGKHVIRRFLPLQDGSKDNWQIGILDIYGKVLAHFYDPNILCYQKEIDNNNSGHSIDKIRDLRL